MMTMVIIMMMNQRDYWNCVSIFLSILNKNMKYLYPGKRVRLQLFSSFFFFFLLLLLSPFLSFFPSELQTRKVKSECGRIAAWNIGLCLVYHKANQYTPLLVEKYFSHSFLLDRVFYNKSTFLFRAQLAPHLWLRDAHCAGTGCNVT